MITDRLKEIEATRAKLAQLEADHSERLQTELVTLPATYGFATTKAFIKAVKTAAGGGRKTAGAEKGKRTRAKITDATRAQAKKLLEAGKTGAQIAAALKISLPSVQNIKKALGLVKARK